ncbi:MAG TPA: FAD-binding oxidoreductase, partial [Sulfurospirillum arcachonense]|nr:FAD-binding oxidoreductase [Sulfurospirillum arcachonense]
MKTLHVEYFKKLVGSDNVYDDKAHLIAYAYDATRNRYEPDLVIFPRDEQDVSE